MTAILGRKVGMTQVFDDRGNVIPVTVIEAGPCVVTEVRTPDRGGDVWDVGGTSKGHGFSGAMERHNFSGQRDTHGVSLMHRAVGSIGISDVARVWPGKRMPGRYGGGRGGVRGRG